MTSDTVNITIPPFAYRSLFSQSNTFFEIFITAIRTLQGLHQAFQMMFSRFGQTKIDVEIISLTPFLEMNVHKIVYLFDYKPVSVFKFYAELR